MGATAFDVWSEVHQVGRVAGERTTSDGDPAGYLEHFLTQDGCWVYTQQLSPSKEVKVVSCAGKVMAPVFWEAKGIVFIDYLQKG